MDNVWLLPAGVMLGWMIWRAADYAPRLAADRCTRRSTIPPLVPPALWQMIARQPKAHFWLHLLVELISALVISQLWVRLDRTSAFLGGMAAYTLLMLITVIDLKHRLILNVITYPAAAAALFFAADWRAALLGGLISFGMFYAIYWLKPGQLGGGDVKLAGLLGLLFGFPGVLWAFIVGVGLGALVAIILLMRRWDRTQTMPYAPFLCFGALVALVYNPFTVCIFACNG